MRTSRLTTRLKQDINSISAANYLNVFTYVASKTSLTYFVRDILGMPVEDLTILTKYGFNRSSSPRHTQA